MTTVTGRSPVEVAEQIAAEVVGPEAAAVDREARFPKQAVDALRAAGLLGAGVPVELGGRGATLTELAAVTAVLGRHCASTAMVFAMHQIQVQCLVRHERTPVLTAFLRDEVAGRQVLLASATTEAGIGGDVRRSSCAVVTEGDRFHLAKLTPVISYGEYADAVLVTARRTPDSPESDQVLVVCRRESPGALQLEPISEWDTLGMRGTCSRGFRLAAADDLDLVLPEPFADVSRRTMLPVAHILWSHAWTGIARAAAAHAGSAVRADARKHPGVVSAAAVNLAQLVAVLQPLEALIAAAVARFDAIAADSEELDALSLAIDWNTLKVAASTTVVDVVTRAMQICGMGGYREDSPLSLGRLLRDAHSATVMIGNDRILAHNAQLLLAVRDR